MNSSSAGGLSYDEDFFDYITIGSMRSAAVVTSLVRRHFPVSSVLDVGCGRGAWLAEWHRAGLADIVGIDGSYVNRQKLLIPSGQFKAQELTERFDLGRTFDLAISLEVAEHIAPEFTDVFIDNLCRHADAVLFSAAVPGQGGTMHVNEQSYEFWRARFAARGYRVFDFVRQGTRGCRDVEAWYRFNSMFFVRGAAIEKLSAIARDSEIAEGEPIPGFAPKLWLVRNAIIKRLPASIVERLIALKQRFVLLQNK